MMVEIGARKRLDFMVYQVVMTANALAADAREGIYALLGKREPEWTGR
jgi:hypothetical protein